MESYLDYNYILIVENEGNPAVLEWTLDFVNRLKF
jgi:hypothetical protein